MELRHLRHFVAVADAGSITQAAEQAHITQPALTRSIGALESLLGAPLLERRPRGVALTPAGAALYERAQLILSECKRAKDDVRAAAAGRPGDLAIGVGAMFADYLVDEAIADICAAFPQSDVSVVSGYFEELYEDLAAGALDVVFCNVPDAALIDRDIAFEPLIEAQAVLVAAPAHPAAKAKSLSRADLAQLRWAAINQPHMREHLARYFALENLALTYPVVRTNALRLIRALLKRGGHVALLPLHLVHGEIARRELVRLAAPEGPHLRPAGLLWRRGALMRAPAKAFMERLRTLCGSTAKDAATA
jgi:DNA-binding transcriptional LysR family regulator